MAIVNGTEYEFIDMQQASGGNTTRHMLRDSKGRAMIAPNEATNMASAAHAKGAYFTYNGLLYRATADIAVGDTIAPGTNCTKAVVGAEIEVLGSAVSGLDSAAFQFRRILSTTDDLDTLTEPGAYWWLNASNIPQHAPFDRGGQVLVFDTGTYLTNHAWVQMAMSEDATLMVRRKTTGSWSDWMEYPKQSFVNNMPVNSDVYPAVIGLPAYKYNKWYKTDGTVQDGGGNYGTTDLIPCYGMRAISFKSCKYKASASNAMACVVFFDKNRNYIGCIEPLGANGTAANYSGHGIVPDDAVYFAATARTQSGYQTDSPFVTLHKTTFDVDLTNILQASTVCYRPNGDTFTGTGWYTTDFVYVHGFKSISFLGAGYHANSANMLETLTFFDASGTRIGGVLTNVSANNARNGKATVKIPETAYYVKLLNKTNMTEVPYMRLHNGVNAPVGIMCMGDSITEGYIQDNAITSRPYPLVMQEKLGIDYAVFNAGVGAMNAATYWQTYVQFLDISNTDIFVLMFGLNGAISDTSAFATDAPMSSSYTNYSDTITGCTCKLIEWIQEQRPNALIVLATPTYAGKSTANEIQAEKQINNLYNLVDRYHLPVIDIRNGMGVNEKNLSHWMATDQVHGKDGTFYEKLGSLFAENITAIDGKLYQDQAARNMLAPTEITSTVSASHATGSYFIYNGILYRATADIAQGGSIVTSGSGQNCEAVTVGAEISELDSKKADNNGTYENMTVGNAEQLATADGVHDAVPYNFRASGGADVKSDREIDKIIGGTVAWNQHLLNGDFSNNSNWYGYNASVSIANNMATITASQDQAWIEFNYTMPANGGWWIGGHKYLFKATVKQDEPGRLALSTNGGAAYANNVVDRTTNVGSWETLFNIFNALNWTSQRFAVTGGDTKNAGNKFYVRDCFAIDLTQMFGSTIADAIYAMEHTTPGSGVAWFRNLFPKDYYAYDAGSLQSVQTSAHKTVGFNQWDEEWELGFYDAGTGKKASGTNVIPKNFIPVLPDTVYYKYQGSDNKTMRLLYYTQEKNYLGSILVTSNGRFTTPKNAYYMTFNVSSGYGTTYNHDICINLSRDGERDGTYEPYTEHTYALDSDLVLRGIPKLDSNNKLYYDGDTYESDGTVTRRYGIVDLGSLTWALDAYSSDAYICSLTDVFNYVSSESWPNMIAAGFICPPYGNRAQYTEPIIIREPTSTHVRALNTGINKDIDAFKTAMSGVYLVYELATQTAESADPYQNPQITDAYGTEEYIDAGNRDVAVPVGHDTLYRTNLRAKIEGLPWDLSMIAPVLKEFKADTALVANDFRVINNELYRITSSIASGAAITPNTNATKTTVGDVLKTLLNNN